MYYNMSDTLTISGLNNFLQGSNTSLVINSSYNTLNGFLFSDFSNKENINDHIYVRGAILGNGCCTADLLILKLYMTKFNIIGFITGHQDLVTLGIVYENNGNEHMPITISCSNNINDTSDSVIKQIEHRKDIKYNLLMTQRPQNITMVNKILNEENVKNGYINGISLIKKNVENNDLFTIEPDLDHIMAEQQKCTSVFDEFVPCLITSYFYNKTQKTHQELNNNKDYVRTLATTLSSAIESKNVCYISYQMFSYPFTELQTKIMKRYESRVTTSANCNNKLRPKITYDMNFDTTMSTLSMCDLRHGNSRHFVPKCLEFP